MSAKVMAEMIKAGASVDVEWHPCADRLLVRRDKGPETTKGGIVLPDRAREKDGAREAWAGVVLAVGVEAMGEGKGVQLPGGRVVHERAPEVGDVVRFLSHAAVELDKAAEVYTIQREDVVAVKRRAPVAP